MSTAAHQMRSTTNALVCSALFAPVVAIAGDYAACILDKMPGISNAPAAFAVHRTCTAQYPSQYSGVQKGAGRGIFAFDNSEECIIKKSKDTSQSNAAFMIAAACRCLYDPQQYKGQSCADTNFVPMQPQ